MINLHIDALEGKRRIEDGFGFVSAKNEKR
jgi:hypothetical protein